MHVFNDEGHRDSLRRHRHLVEQVLVITGWGRDAGGIHVLFDFACCDLSLPGWRSRRTRVKGVQLPRGAHVHGQTVAHLGCSGVPAFVSFLLEVDPFSTTATSQPSSHSINFCFFVGARPEDFVVGDSGLYWHRFRGLLSSLFFLYPASQFPDFLDCYAKALPWRHFGVSFELGLADVSAPPQSLVMLSTASSAPPSIDGGRCMVAVGPGRTRVEARGCLLCLICLRDRQQVAAPCVLVYPSGAHDPP